MRKKLFEIYVRIAVIWVIFALLFDLYLIFRYGIV